MIGDHRMLGEVMRAFCFLYRLNCLETKGRMVRTQSRNGIFCPRCTLHYSIIPVYTDH